jgi:hypothetical protein
MLARDDVRRLQMFRHYLLGTAEPVESQIPKAPLHDVVFGLLAGQVARNEDALIDFICGTFAYSTLFDSRIEPSHLTAPT